MRLPKRELLRAIGEASREFRTEEEFKEAFRNGRLGWSEIHRYYDWRDAEKKDGRASFRISSVDLMKLKALARIQGKKFHAYVGEILKREIHFQEDRLAAGVPAE